MASLQAMTALGAREAAMVTVGSVTIAERVDVALASVAARRGHDLQPAANAAGVPLPGPARYQSGTPYSGFWVAPDMWFVEAPFATHELIADHLKAAFGAAASITEQTDAWVVFDLAAPDLAPLMERLCNVDFAGVSDGHATRTVIEHLGCYLVRQSRGNLRLYGPRSSAQSLLHALEAAALSAC
ncbi:MULTISPECIES: sarcosine oxidase subunit gamma [Tabrizicola]|uniref:sarcosine oxidase subunit gamma n=1 Tax=Tabrizicola TaxID=1443919 RepID=UPI001081DA9E|nr:MULTISPECIES: sarcosine oxidase subunit gamma [Paracoccaceae]